MTRRADHPPRRSGGALAALAAVLLVAGLAGCSGDEESKSSDAEQAAPSSAEPSVPTKASFGKVRGNLPKGRRGEIKKSITATVDGWLDAAYVGGDGPRPELGKAFPRFSKGAAALARRDAGLMSNSGLGDSVEAVEAKSRRLMIDVLAVQGRPVGVTARFVLVQKLTGERDRTERIAGRLLLDRLNGSWRIFGYDVTRGKR